MRPEPERRETESKTCVQNLGEGKQGEGKQNLTDASRTQNMHPEPQRGIQGLKEGEQAQHGRVWIHNTGPACQGLICSIGPACYVLICSTGPAG